MTTMYRHVIFLCHFLRSDTIEVKITEIDKQGRVNASHRALEE
ncbi:hypothetical protein [Staphylococcus aureus]